MLLPVKYIPPGRKAQSGQYLGADFFALNRIYTEWYRGRGYDFDITNSTQYDQYFVENRDIYENISQIVDDIFNNYVVKGKHSPLFLPNTATELPAPAPVFPSGDCEVGQPGNDALRNFCSITMEMKYKIVSTHRWRG